VGSITPALLPISLSVNPRWPIPAKKHGVFCFLSYSLFSPSAFYCSHKVKQT
jgi:hypothetical protein